MLATELDHVEERFQEIVAGLEGNSAVWAKVQPLGPDEGASREEELESLDDEDALDGDDIEFP